MPQVPTSDGNNTDIAKKPLSSGEGLRVSVTTVMDKNPDETAELQKIARRTGVPFSVLKDPDNRKKLEKREALETFPFEAYSNMFPSSTSLLNDPDFASIAYDDMQTLGGLERILKATAAGGSQAGLDLVESVLRTPDTLARISRAGGVSMGGFGAYAQTLGALADIGGLNAAADAVQNFQSDLPEKYESFRRIAAKGEQADKAFNEAFEGNLEPMWHVVRDPEAWAAFIGNAIPSLAVGLYSGASVPVTMWLEGMSASNSAAEFEENTGIKMSDAQFSQAILQTGIINGILEKTGLDAILGVPGGGLSAVLKAALSEGGTEAAQQLNQNLATYLSYNSQQSLSEGVLASVMGGAAAGGSIAGGVSAVDRATRRIQERERKAQDGEQSAQTVEQLTQLAQSSKLLQRDPDSFERFIEAANAESEVQDIYLDPKELAQSGIDVAKLAEISPSVKKQAQLATETGGLLKIPVSEYASTLAASEFGQPLLDHARTDPLGMSRNEAKEFMQSAKEEFEAEVEKSLEASGENRVFLQSREAVFENVLDQLDTANRFTEDVNRQYASLLSNFYAVQASRLGITPEEMFARYPVGIQAESVASGAVFNQDEITAAQERDGEAFFDPRALTQAKDQSAKSRDILVYMAPEDFLKVAMSGHDANKENTVQKLVESGTKFESVPFLNFVHDGEGTAKVTGHEGRHRARALMAAGVKEMPVVLSHRYDENGQGLTWRELENFNDEFPKNLYAEFGDTDATRGNRGNNIPFPVKDPRALAQGQRGSFNPETSVITLFNAADLSTFLHETGHFFLETLNKMALDPNAPHEIKADMEATLKWLGVTATTPAEGGPQSGELDQAPVDDFKAAPVEKTRYEKQINKLLTEGLPRGEILQVGRTPRVLRAVGAPNLPVTMRPVKVEKILEKHDISPAIIKNIPDLLADPVMVLSSGTEDGALVVVTEAKDTEGRTVLAAIHLKQEEERHFVNRVASVYGKEGEARWLQEQIDKGRLLYAHKEKALQLSQSARLQLPGEVTDAERKRIVLRKPLSVKPYAQGGEDGEKGQLPQGDSALDVWNRMSLEEKRPYHEKFARGFEAYLFEGKAPNAEVAGIMGRFRDWLLMVYKNIRNLDVEVSDDIRGVFDRLLATNESIAEAESLTGFTAMFASAEDAGMSPEEWTQYQKLGQEATEHARAELGARTVRDIKWLSNARSKKLKELQRDAETKRRAIRREVTEEVMNEPVNQARAFIRTGKTVDGTQTEGTHRLDIAALKDMYGEGDDALWRTLESKYGKYGMVGNDGLHPDAVAEQFGFSSGDELVQALVTAENPRDKIQGMTDQRMIERYGDISDPKSLELAADAAIHNDARARFVATEVNALNKATGKRKILTDAAKQYGALMIARLRVRDVKPARYKAAEAKAARAAEKAMRSGDIETAAIEKRSQLVQMHAAKAAIEALDEIDKAVKYFNKFNKDAVREKLAADYVEQIDALLERFDLRKGQSLKQIDKRTSLANWIEAQKEVGIEPDIPTEILDGANRKHYKDMTVEEMRGLVDTVKQIEHLGRLKEKLLTAADNRDFQRTVEDLRDSIYNNGKGRVVDNTTRATAGDRAMRLFKGYIAQHRKIASLARQMDGVKDGGPMWETFIRSMNEAGDNEAAMRADATEKLAVLVAPLMKQGKMGGKGVFFPSIGRSLNREERIALALNTGNAGNLQRLLDGEKWTAEQIQPVLDTITPEEAKFVQSVWDLFESYRPQIAAKEKRIYGKEPEWVEPVPLVLGGVELRGGYFPIKYDARRNATAERHNDAELAKQQMKGAYTSATTRRSFTKTRADEVLGRPLVLTMDGLYTGLNEVIHDLSWHEWLIDANRLMRSKKLDAAIRETYGAETVQQFKTAIQDIAAGEMPSGGAFERAVGNLRNGASVAGLGLNIVTAAINVTGVAQSCVRVGPKWVLQGVDAWASDPFGLVGKIYEKSDFMRLRGQTMNREINEIQNMLRDKTKIRAAIDRYSYLPLTVTQVAIDTPTWWGAYQKALAEGNDETRAVALADQAVIDSQGGGQVKDLAAIQRGGPIQKLFTTFYSYFSTTLQLTAEQTAKTNFKDPADVIRLGGDYLMLYTVPALFGTIIRGILGGDGDDWLEDPASLAQAYANEQISYAFGTLVGLREASGAVQKAFGVNQYDMAYGGPAGLRFLSEIDKLGSQLGQGELDRALFRSLINVGGIYLRLPSGQINRTIDGAASIIEGNSINPGSLITGGPRD